VGPRGRYLCNYLPMKIRELPEKGIVVKHYNVMGQKVNGKDRPLWSIGDGSLEFQGRRETLRGPKV